MARIVVAPDSFKGSADAGKAATAIAAGWGSVRPNDVAVTIPQADGGEGTLDVIATAAPGATWHERALCVGPDGRSVTGKWISLTDGTAFIELAQVSGLTLMQKLDPMGAQTRGLGQVLRAAIEQGAKSLAIAVGGSASTDGGVGAMRELGARFLNADDNDIPDGGGGIAELARIDLSDVLAAPPGGVRILCDVRSPLLGPNGAAAVFGPQKGATAVDIARLDANLAILAALLGGDPDHPGYGAVGGAAYGLAQLWDVDIVSGAVEVEQLTHLPQELDRADLLITGEGRYDASSKTGKVVDSAIALAHSRHVPVIIIAGSISEPPDDANVRTLSLEDQAGSTQEAMNHAEKYLELAGRAAAEVEF